MTPQDLIATLDKLTEAPAGMTRLRELVLRLAVRGQLVPQEPDDEPANVLLERIALEKARLYQAGLIRKPKKLPPVGHDDVPFEVPRGWAWTRFGLITDTRLGKMLDKAKNSGPMRPYLRNANLQWFEFVLDDLKQLRLEESELAECSVRAGDLVICEGGEPGRAAVCDDTVDGMVYQKALHRVRPLCGIDPWYLAYLLRCDTWSGRLSELFTGATIKHLTGRSLASYTVPLPPLAEQKRIVARVDELMSLLDNLEEKQGAQETTRVALRDSALAALRDAATPEVVEAAWARIAGRMDDLFTDPADVEPLRQTVLQLAVRGRLVPQDPADEPASVLLARIAAEKSRLVKEKKIRKLKALPPVSVEEMPFEVPTGWAWRRMGDLLVDIQSGWSPAAEKRPKEGKEWGVLKVSACSWGRFRPNENKALRPGTEPRKHLEVRPGDFLISRANTRELVARSVVVDDCPPRLMLSDKTLRLSVGSGAFVPYVNLANLGSSARAHYEERASGTSDSMRNVSQTVIRNAPIPVPPLAEQRRIMARFTELDGLLEDLKQRLNNTKAAQDAFAAAAVHHLDA